MLPLWSVASEQCGEVSVAPTDRAGWRESGDARRMEGETMTAKRKRPKVRYVARYVGGAGTWYMVCHVDYGEIVSGHVCDCESGASAKRIAAALNLYEATKRREI